MIANVSAKNSAPVSTEEKRMIAKRFPQRAGLLRCIHLLWAGAYRVNYHQEDGGHYIVESWFVTLENGHVLVQ